MPEFLTVETAELVRPVPDATGASDRANPDMNR